MPPKEDDTAGLDAWTEPSLRPAVPSFMDHRGLERGGVLEQMMPLGAMPTAKVKARAKAEPVRRHVQVQPMGSMMMDDARSTPDLMAVASEAAEVQAFSDAEMNNLFNASYPQSLQQTQLQMQLLQDLQGYQAAMPQMQQMQPMQQISQMPQMHQMQQMPPYQPSPPPLQDLHPLQPMQAMQAMQSTFSIVSPPPANPPQGHVQHGMQVTPSQPSGSGSARVTPSSKSPFDRSFRGAVQLAQQAGSPQLEYQLTQLQMAAAQDPEFATLLSYAVTNNSLHEKGSAVNRKLKQLKQMVRSQNPSSATQGSSLSGMNVGPSQSSFFPQTTTSGNFQNFDALIAAGQNQPSPSGRMKQKGNAAASASNGSSQIDPSLNLSGERAALSRSRASSSSLSSVDEQVAAGPPPVEAQMHQNMEVDVPGAEDMENEARRKRMRKNFDDLPVNESGVRQSLPAKALSTARRARGKASKPPPTPVPLEAMAKIPISTAANGNASGEASTSTPPPPAVPTALGRPPKRLKATTAKVKISPVKNRQPAVFAGFTRPDRLRHSSVDIDSKSQVSENNDYCSACGGTGFLLCCDGCDRSFHFTCLDPPLDQHATLDEPWFCYICHSKAPEESADLSLGLFSELQRRILGKNPSSFKLPEYIREYFEGVKTGESGEYLEIQIQRPSTNKSRLGYDDPPDYYKLKDPKGNAILCYQCGESALPHDHTNPRPREVVPCDYCSANWHLDCVNPPLSTVPNRGLNGKTRPLWMCPLHTEHDLRRLDPITEDGALLNGIPRQHRIRRPKKVQILETALRRGFKNNGLIEIAEEESEDEFTDEESPEGVVFKVPARGVKLDFIDRCKSDRALRTALDKERAASLQLQIVELEHANQVALIADINKRRIEERKAILNLAQFSSNNPDLNLGTTELEKLLYVLEAEAPEEVVQQIKQEESDTNMPFKLDSEGDVGAIEPLTKRERDTLLRLQQHISSLLEKQPSTNGTKGAYEYTNGHAVSPEVEEL